MIPLIVMLPVELKLMLPTSSPLLTIEPSGWPAASVWVNVSVPSATTPAPALTVITAASPPALSAATVTFPAVVRSPVKVTSLADVTISPEMSPSLMVTSAVPARRSRTLGPPRAVLAKVITLLPEVMVTSSSSVTVPSTPLN